MAQAFHIHPTHPQMRLIKQAADILRRGGVISYPTDASYGIGCLFNDVSSLGKLRQLRGLDDRHPLTLLCSDVSQVSTYAKVDNRAFRLIRNLTPGPYTFILDATREVPRKLHQKSKKTIGVRIPDHPILQMLLVELGTAMASTTCVLPGDDMPLTDPYDIEDGFGHALDGVIHGEIGQVEGTTVIDLTEGHADIIRHGLGDTSTIE